MFEEAKVPADAVPNATPGRVVFFVDENGRPSLKDEFGDVISMSFRGGFAPKWKGDVVGNPFIDGDTVDAAVGDMVMCQIVDPETLTINFPTVTEADAGKELRLVNLTDKKFNNPGAPLLVPATGDRIGVGGVDEVVTIFESDDLFGIVTFVYDGNGQWHAAAFGGNEFIAAAPV